MSGSVIVAGARTPIGRLLGGLKDQSAADLGGVAIKGALEKSGVAPEQVDYLILGGAVGVRRKEHERLGAGLGCLLGPALGLKGTVRADAGHDGEALGGRFHRGGDDAGPLLGSEGLVLAQRTVGRDAVAAIVGQELYVFGEGIEVNAQVVLELQRRGDENSVPGFFGLSHGGSFRRGMRCGREVSVWIRDPCH